MEATIELEEEKATKEERALENDLDKTFRPNDPSMDLFDYPHDPSMDMFDAPPFDPLGDHLHANNFPQF